MNLAWVMPSLATSSKSASVRPGASISVPATIFTPAGRARSQRRATTARDLKILASGGSNGGRGGAPAPPQPREVVKSRGGGGGGGRGGGVRSPRRHHGGDAAVQVRSHP